VNIRIFLIVGICIVVLFDGQSQKVVSSFSPALFYQKNKIGISYQQYSQSGQAILFSFHDHDPRFGNSNFHIHLYNNPFEEVKEQYQNLLLNGNYYLNKRFSVLFEIPYNISTRYFEEAEPYRLQGLGDVKIGANYHFYDSKLFKPDASLQQISSISVLGKFKTGKYNIANELNDIDPYLQTGTGSFDVSATLLHQVLYNRLNFNAALSYYYTGISYYQLKFGNRYAFQLGGSYAIIQQPDLQLHILNHISYIKKQKDTLESKDIARPNQYSELLFDAGFLLNYSNWALQLQAAIPVAFQYEYFTMRWKMATSFKIFYTFN